MHDQQPMPIALAATDPALCDQVAGFNQTAREPHDKRTAPMCVHVRSHFAQPCDESRMVAAR